RSRFWLAVERSRFYAHADRVRQMVAELIHANSDEVTFIKNTSEGINFVANGLTWKSGDNVVTTSMEFPANIYPWMNLEQRGVTGIVFGNIHLADVREWYETRVTAAGLAHVEPLWGEPPLSLVREVVERGFRPIVVSVDLQQGAADLLGREIDDDFVKTVEGRKNMDPCGERGEYHTFVYAGPTFNEPIALERGDVREERNHSLLDLLPPAPNPSP
ncbi:MAG: aminotransferase class V-fold PLP-dependent enzyme, partial [Gemmatimonadetes bacterium]|nr:aminotransferase class V-fold PLP-dependent enzyme [Gemmatimonadota bacterium]